MKHNQKKTQKNRVKKTMRVHGNPMFGMRSHNVVVSHYTPKELHEAKMPDYCKMNKNHTRGLR